MKDVTAPQHVEVTIRPDGKVLWVNVDGTCVLRVCHIAEPIVIDDRRPTHEEKPKADFVRFVYVCTEGGEEYVLRPEEAAAWFDPELGALDISGEIMKIPSGGSE